MQCNQNIIDLYNRNAKNHAIKVIVEIC